jgi:hypothetical protein
MTFRIGIISDTHGLLRPEAERLLEGVDHIVHGGDIGRPEIVAALRRIAPVTAIRGNVDTGDWARDYAETERVRLAERSIFVLHDLNALRIDPVAVGIDVIVSGHSHVPKIDAVDGILYLNPGSAGPRRFKLPITLATLDVTADGPGRSFTNFKSVEGPAPSSQRRFITGASDDDPSGIGTYRQAGAQLIGRTMSRPIRAASCRVSSHRPVSRRPIV